MIENKPQNLDELKQNAGLSDGEDKELKDGYVFAYVKNLDDENCSEFGTIKVAPVNGGITRLQ